MKEIIKKLASAKKSIKNTKMKKEGRNEFSKYDYFTPAQIEDLVYNACDDNNLMTKFDLIRNELGVFGRLTVIDILTAEQLTFDMATAIPEIKATNIAQQLGGCVTYTERYLKMSAFGITENSLDFDTTENTKKAEVKPILKSDANISAMTPIITDKQFQAVYDRLEKGEMAIFEKTVKSFKLSESQLKKLTDLKNEIETELNFKK